MSEHYFDALEQKIDQLLLRVTELEQQNEQLLGQTRQLREERAQLLNLHEQTRTKVEGMITRLKALEQQS